MHLFYKLRRHGLSVLICGWIGCFSSTGSGADENHFGFFYDQFGLTLEDGRRTEALGPFFYSQDAGEATTWAIPPFFSRYTNAAVEAREDDYLYPLLTYESYGQERRWQFCQLFSSSGGQNPDGGTKTRFTIYPFYFQQRSTDTNKNYTALAPFYGHLKDRMMRDEIFFVMFPLYSETRKKDVVTDNYLYPFFDVRRGNGLRGWQFWPMVGAEHKIMTTQTNGFGDVSTNGGYERSFFLWPFHLRQDNGIGTANPEKIRASIPLYVISRSPQRDSTTIIWPLFSWIDDRDKKYHEWQGPWPFVIFTRGEGKTTSRVWPLFSQSHNSTVESDSYLWPLYQYHRLHADPLDRQSTRCLFYAYVHVTEKNTATAAQKDRLDMWPFFIWRKDFNGNTRLQILALLEPVLAENRGIERNWSPLWALWREEWNPRTGAHSQSFLWNLYRRDTTAESRKCSLLFGLFQYQCQGETKKLRLFYIPVIHSHGPAK